VAAVLLPALKVRAARAVAVTVAKTAPLMQLLAQPILEVVAVARKVLQVLHRAALKAAPVS
jgi:hypothetical protein